MKGFIAAALLTMPLSLFAEGGTTSGGTTPMGKVVCVGKKGTTLSDDQKKALETAGVKAKTFKSWKSEEVAKSDECKGAYTIENGTASKVMHKKASTPSTPEPKK